MRVAALPSVNSPPVGDHLDRGDPEPPPPDVGVELPVARVDDDEPLNQCARSQAPLARTSSRLFRLSGSRSRSSQPHWLAPSMASLHTSRPTPSIGRAIPGTWSVTSTKSGT